MHSRIFQISTEQIDKENYLDENTLNQGDDSFYDYCANIDDEERKEDIANLVNYLPKGMFELVSEDTMENPQRVDPVRQTPLTLRKKSA